MSVVGIHGACVLRDRGRQVMSVSIAKDPWLGVEGSTVDRSHGAQRPLRG